MNRAILTIFLFLGAMALNGQTLSQKIFEQAMKQNKPVIMAHRMAPAHGFAENSIRTLKYNIRNYPETMQEIDVRISRDGVPVLLHDETLERSTTGKGKLKDYSFRELKSLHLKDSKGEVLTEKIPTLKETLRLAKKSGTLLMLDMKPGTDPDVMMKVVNAAEMSSRVIVICYSLKEGIVFNEKYPEVNLALGFNSFDLISEIYGSKLPTAQLIALSSSTIQSADYYDLMTKKGTPISFSAQGGIDLSADSDILYRKVFQDHKTAIICTDSLVKAVQAFRK